MKNDSQTNKVIKMELGKMKISEALKYLRPIAEAYGLRLNRVSELKMAKVICANLYSSTT